MDNRTLEDPAQIDEPDAPARAGGVNWFAVVSMTVLAAYCFFLIYPLSASVVFTFSSLALHEAVEAVSTPGFRKALFDTLLIVAPAGLGAVGIGTVFAWLNQRTDASMGWLSNVLPVVTLLLPPITLASGWFFLAHPRIGFINIALREFVPIDAWASTGPLNINTTTMLIWVYILYLVPFAYVVLLGAFRNVSPSYEEASRVSGASPLRTFLRVSVPAVFPSIAAAALLVWMTGLAAYSLPALLAPLADRSLLSVRIVRLMREAYPPRADEAVVIAAVLVAIVSAAWFVASRVQRRQVHATIGGRDSNVGALRLGPWRWPMRAAMVGYLLLAMALPFIALIFVSVQPFWTATPDLSTLSFNSYQRLFHGSTPMLSAVQNSLFLGFVGATAAMLMAMVLLLYAQRASRARGVLIDAATKAPGAITNVVIGLGFVIALGGPPFNLGGTVLVLLIAYVVIYMPAASVSAGSGLDQVGSDLTEASSVAGARGGRTFARIVLPLSRPALGFGWALVFVLMVGDLTASSLLATGPNPVVSFVILSIWNNSTYPDLAAAAVVLVAISLSVVGLAFAFAGRKGASVASR